MIKLFMYMLHRGSGVLAQEQVHEPFQPLVTLNQHLLAVVMIFLSSHMLKPAPKSNFLSVCMRSCGKFPSPPKKLSAKSTSMTQELNQVKALVYTGGCLGNNQSFRSLLPKQSRTKTKPGPQSLTNYINKVTVQREQATTPPLTKGLVS